MNWKRCVTVTKNNSGRQGPCQICCSAEAYEPAIVSSRSPFLPLTTTIPAPSCRPPKSNGILPLPPPPRLHRRPAPGQGDGENTLGSGAQASSNPSSSSSEQNGLGKTCLRVFRYDSLSSMPYAFIDMTLRFWPTCQPHPLPSYPHHHLHLVLTRPPPAPNARPPMSTQIAPNAPAPAPCLIGHLTTACRPRRHRHPTTPALQARSLTCVLSLLKKAKFVRSRR